jgi:hypothetical protein
MRFSYLTPRKAVTVVVAWFLVTLATFSRIAAEEADRELKIGTLRVGKILFLGNSITLHGPKADIGWEGNWGMAASSREKDYVHQLLNRMSKVAGGTPQIKVRNIADFERQLTDINIGETLKEELDFHADMVILAIGENSASPKTDDERRRFSTALQNLLQQLQQHGEPKIFVRSQFWADADKDRLLKQACQQAGGVFVDLGKLGADPANAAHSERKIEHAGVAGHPGDRGMAAIADALWTAIQEAAKLSK